jgi:exodeoxyribonuclease-3
MRIATWNVNSIRQREQHLARWLERTQPDAVVLQEIKCEAVQFPTATFEALDYQSFVVGQKSYNGIALLSRLPFTITAPALPGLSEAEPQARYLEAEIGGITLIGIYLPNGNSGGEAGYAYKLAWMDRLAERAEALMRRGTPFAILGDYNVCPAEIDCAPGALPATDALRRPETISRFRRLLWAGLTDAVRALYPRGPRYTFWDYQAGAFRRDMGLRIDHALLSPALAEQLQEAVIDRDERAETQPSDHVPVTVTMAPV